MSDQTLERLDGLATTVLDLAGDVGEVQVTVDRTRHGLTRFANSAIHQHVGADVTQVALTVAVDGRVAGGSTSRLDGDDLRRFVAGVVEAARLNPVDPRWPGLTPPTPVDVPDRSVAGVLDVTPAERAELVGAFVEAGGDLEAAGYSDTEVSWRVVASSTGHRASGRGTRATIDGIHRSATSAGAGHATGAGPLDVDTAREQGEEAARIATDAVDARDLEPGTLPVLLGHEAAATLVQFVGAYGFNAQAHLDGQSPVLLGQAQFDPSVTLVDDPEGGLGLPFDADGTPRQRVVLVDGGTSTSLLHDRRTAAQVGGGTTSTGNAVPGGASWGAFPLDLRLLPGDAPADGLLAGVERGLWVRAFNYCRVLDPRTLVVTGLTRNGVFLVEDGRVVAPVTNLRFTQSFTEALAPGNVVAVGDTDRYADAEFGAGMVRTPALHLAAWRFSGGAGG
ncbi:MAG: TldD/PmbA family protein [Actinomycetes bacterium]